MELNNFDEAEREYARAVALEPSEPTAQLGLAKLRYVRGDPHFARDLVVAARDRSNGLLQFQFANVLRHTGDLVGSELLLRDLIARVGATPELRSSLATLLHATGRLHEAEGEARTAVNGRPTDANILANWVTVLLSLGRTDDALPVIRAARARAPLDAAWIAHEAIAARVAGDPAHSVLYDYEAFVRVYDLEAPAGWDSIGELNAALAKGLTARHGRVVRHPFDQSMRFGTQTIGDLQRVPDAAIQALLQAFLEPIADYRAKLGTDVDHPLSARNKGESRYAGCWSVQLTQQGFHLNHLHPEGWLSSAYYVSVPAEAADVGERSGWIKFGEPSLPVPGAEPGFAVQPRPGRLVLFPSYMWHGTTAIRGTEPRLTIAFDVVTSA